MQTLHLYFASSHRTSFLKDFNGCHRSVLLPGALALHGVLGSDHEVLG